MPSMVHADSYPKRDDDVCVYGGMIVFDMTMQQLTLARTLSTTHVYQSVTAWMQSTEGEHHPVRTLLPGSPDQYSTIAVNRLMQFLLAFARSVVSHSWPSRTKSSPELTTMNCGLGPTHKEHDTAADVPCYRFASYVFEKVYVPTMRLMEGIHSGIPSNMHGRPVPNACIR